MSKILRRPLFRGGRVDSTGVGITHGLDHGLHHGYAIGGRVGYKDGPGPLPQDIDPNSPGYFENPNITKPATEAVRTAEAAPVESGIASLEEATPPFLKRNPATGLAEAAEESGFVRGMGGLGRLVGKIRPYASTVAPFLISFEGTKYLANKSQQEFNRLSPQEQKDYIKYSKQFGEVPQNIMGDITGVPTYTPDSTLPTGYKPPYKGPLDLIFGSLFGGDKTIPPSPVSKEDYEDLFGKKTEKNIPKLSEEEQLQKKVDMYSKAYGLDKAQTQSIYDAMLAAAPGFLSGRTLREAAPQVFANIVASKAFDKPQAIREVAAKAAIDEQIKENLMDKKTQQLMGLLNTKLGSQQTIQKDLQNVYKGKEYSLDPLSSTNPIQIKFSEIRTNPNLQKYVDRLPINTVILIKDPITKEMQYARVTGRDVKTNQNILGDYKPASTFKPSEQTTSDENLKAIVANSIANQQ